MSQLVYRVGKKVLVHTEIRGIHEFVVYCLRGRCEYSLGLTITDAMVKAVKQVHMSEHIWGIPPTTPPEKAATKRGVPNHRSGRWQPGMRLIVHKKTASGARSFGCRRHRLKPAQVSASV
ncbi:hypothetical protein ACL02S_22180 [Nocardia sp. 004]|uniref:hypothetical protein n=1 Tax=Nocardia sp. 004 TaxID=3385978 RepID=UPI00399F42D2